MKTMSSPEYPSLLTRDESSAIKGFLILLVILGHNSLITGNVEIFGKKILYPFLYSFHVYSFYILPFLYGFTVKNCTTPLWCYLWTRLKRNFVRLYSIYLIFFGICVIVSMVVAHSRFGLFSYIYAFITGNQTLLNKYAGFGFLWFLPTMCAVLLWRDIYFCIPKIGKLLFILTAALLWSMAFAGIANFHSLGDYIPFALCQGLYFSLSAITARIILEHLKVTLMSQILCILLFILIPVFIYCRDLLPYEYTYLSWSLAPTVAFVCIYQYKSLLCRSKFIAIMGRYSLPVYLVHVFIFNACLRIVPRDSLLMGITVYLVTVCGSLLVSVLLEKNCYAKRILFS